jgi:hypothetical protein
MALNNAEKSAEEMAQVQARLAAKATEVHDLRIKLQKRDKQLSVR